MPQTTHDSTTSAGGIPSSCHRFGCLSGCLALRHRIFLLFFCPTHTVPSLAAPGHKEEDDPAQSWRQPSTVTAPPGPVDPNCKQFEPGNPDGPTTAQGPTPSRPNGPKTNTETGDTTLGTTATGPGPGTAKGHSKKRHRPSEPAN